MSVLDWACGEELETSVRARLTALGVETVGDLGQLKAADVTMIGGALTSAQAQKFNECLVRALDALEAEEAEEEVARAHQEAGRLRQEKVAQLMCMATKADDPHVRALPLPNAKSRVPLREQARISCGSGL